MDALRIGVVGCAGRMGRMVARCVDQTEGCELAGGTDRADCGSIGRDLGELAGIGPRDLVISDDPVAMIAKADAVIDFTTPEALLTHAELVAQAQAFYVVGTTGLGDEQQAALERAGLHTPVVQGANMSLGVNLLLALVERVSGALDADYDIEIVEMHHRHKVDAPSGTALALGRAAAKGRGVDLDEAAQKVRDGHTGARGRGDIGFATLRGGDVVGDHTVVFAADGERIELAHKASTREVFARGAIRAALWCRGQSPGLYTMRDVLGLGG